MPSLNHFRENWKLKLGSTFEKLDGDGSRYLGWRWLFFLIYFSNKITNRDGYLSPRMFQFACIKI
jgi:hypothetical protein